MHVLLQPADVLGRGLGRQDDQRRGAVRLPGQRPPRAAERKDMHASPRGVEEDALEVIEQAGGIVGPVGADEEHGRLFPAFVGEKQRVVEAVRVALEPERSV